MTLTNYKHQSMMMLQQFLDAVCMMSKALICNGFDKKHDDIKKCLINEQLK
ncbi:hypothetical protein [Sodalis endosymbiont of Henestaris halophilus]|uniref:hypothetical protein n=1 Tax=Sodalis endosymbiont of Henestaris halophilus TaxID=1929246 RepID=UPI0012FDD0AA|nr:hypothetical protein [Sodalis endosymbiont of Henestaris halophilus]